MTVEPNSLSRLVELAEKQESKLLGHNNSMKEKERKLTQLLVIGLALFINALARLPLNLTVYSFGFGFLCLGCLVLYFAIALKVFYYTEELSFTDPKKLLNLLERVGEEEIEELSKLLNEQADKRVTEGLLDSLYFTNLLEQILPGIIAYNEKLQKGLRFIVILFFFDYNFRNAIYIISSFCIFFIFWGLSIFLKAGGLFLLNFEFEGTRKHKLCKQVEFKRIDKTNP